LPYAKIIHIDIDPASISKTVRVDIPIVGDVKPVLEQMLEMIKESPKNPIKKDWSFGGIKLGNGKQLTAWNLTVKVL